MLNMVFQAYLAIYFARTLNELNIRLVLYVPWNLIKDTADTTNAVDFLTVENIPRSNHNWSRLRMWWIRYVFVCMLVWVPIYIYSPIAIHAASEDFLVREFDGYLVLYVRNLYVWRAYCTFISGWPDCIVLPLIHRFAFKTSNTYRHLTYRQLTNSGQTTQLNVDQKSKTKHKTRETATTMSRSPPQQTRWL